MSSIRPTTELIKQHLYAEFSASAYLCWTRMQAEAGQTLEAIVARKERERAAGGGVFLWGVGNAPSIAIKALARLEVPIPVVFSSMKSKPKSIDVAPGRTVVWRRYINEYGVERSLPDNSLVTSRGDSASGAKSKHYALMCYSDSPLVVTLGRSFDPSAFRNVGGAGAPVGASQVTALLRQIDQPKSASDYEANIVAWLTEGYWVRLTDPIELTPNQIRQIATFDGDGSQWLAFVEHVRGKTAPESSTSSGEGALF